jgi:hypothetical protein
MQRDRSRTPSICQLRFPARWRERQFVYRMWARSSDLEQARIDRGFMRSSLQNSGGALKAPPRVLTLSLIGASLTVRDRCTSNSAGHNDLSTRSVRGGLPDRTSRRLPPCSGHGNRFGTSWHCWRRSSSAVFRTHRISAQPSRSPSLAPLCDKWCGPRCRCGCRYRCSFLFASARTHRRQTTQHSPPRRRPQAVSSFLSLPL